MTRPEKLTAAELEQFLVSHPEWKSEDGAISRLYKFDGYPRAVSFVVAVALHAERRDHHPDIELSWGKVRLRWATHDAGGVTALDVELAETSDALFQPSSPGPTT